MRAGGATAADAPVASPVLIEMAAVSDSTLKFSADCSERTVRWLPELKNLYQSLRCGAKRPWPEFLAALTSGVHLTDADCDCVYLLTRIPLVGLVGTVPTMSETVKDGPLTSKVLGADGRWCKLSDFVTDACVDETDLRRRAARLGLSTRCTKAALEQKIASRVAEMAYLEAHSTATGVYR